MKHAGFHSPGTAPRRTTAYDAAALLLRGAALDSSVVDVLGVCGLSTAVSRRLQREGGVMRELAEMLAILLTGLVLGLFLAVEMHWVSPPMVQAHETCR